MAFSTQIFGPNTGISIANRKQAAAMGVKAASQGRGGDKYSIQATPFTANLLKNMGGATSFNPETGEMEFFFGGYSSIGDMFDGGGPGASSPDQNNKTYDNDNIAGNEVTGIAAASNRSAGNADRNAATQTYTDTGSDSDDRVPVVSSSSSASKNPLLMGFDSVADMFDKGGAGRSGSSYSTEGSIFDPDGVNNYVDPNDPKVNKTGGVNNDGMGGSDGKGNAGNMLTNITNDIIGNDKMGRARPQVSDVDEEIVALVGSDEKATRLGIKTEGDYVKYKNGVNYSGSIGGQYFVNGKPVDDVAAFGAGMSSGGDDDMGPAAPMNYSTQSFAGGQAGGTYDYTPLFGGMELGNSAEMVEGINAEIASLEQQIAEISASGSGQDTSMMEAELVSLQNQLASYGLSSQEVSEYISTLDPNSPDYNPEAYQAAFGFALQPNYDGGVVDPSDPTVGGGGYVRRAVKDRETGEVRYVNVPINVDSGMDQFRGERRAGFGRAIDSGMYV
jgi:hypothetical protein